MLIQKVLDYFRRPPKVKRLMEDELFGTLTWEESPLSAWCGITTMANGKTTKFFIDGLKTDEAIPEEVRNTVKFLIANEPQIRNKIAISMSEIYNGTWSGGDTITPEELAQKITLTCVSWYGEGEGGMLYYEADDELFTDHTICAPIDENGEIGEPEIEG